jgi:hypothetical protein
MQITPFGEQTHALTNSRVERIGEARFGETREFYCELAQITKRLILEKGFNVIAIEGDLPSSTCFYASTRPEWSSRWSAWPTGKRVKKRPKPFHLGMSLRWLVQTVSLGALRRSGVVYRVNFTHANRLALECGADSSTGPALSPSLHAFFSGIALLVLTKIEIRRQRNRLSNPVKPLRRYPQENALPATSGVA